MVTYFASFMAALVLVASTRIGGRFQRMDAPVFGVIMFTLFVAWSVIFTVLGNMSLFLFGTAGR